MKKVDQWMMEYNLTHRNRYNKIIHKICVPVIYWSVLTLLWMLPRVGPMNGFFNWGTLGVVLFLGFYLSLGFVYFVEMFFVSIMALIIDMGMEKAGLPVATIAVIAFVVAWIGQFYGHTIEGRRPAFFTDLLFLFIGPLWVVNSLKKPAPTPKGQ